MHQAFIFQYEAAIYNGLMIVIACAMILSYLNVGRWYLRQVLDHQVPQAEMILWRFSFFTAWPAWMLVYFFYDIYTLVLRGED